MDVLMIPEEKQEELTKMLNEFSKKLENDIFGRVIHTAILFFSIDENGNMKDSRPITSFPRDGRHLLACATVMGMFAQAAIAQESDQPSIILPH